jgi:cell division protein FtsB
MAQPQSSAPAPVRSAKLTGRAALLAVVMCVIALSLAYPVREYIAQRQQINALLIQEQSLTEQVKSLGTEAGQLQQSWYIEQEARDMLHWCGAGENCYEVVDGSSPFAPTATTTQLKAATPWYDNLWHSVQKADQR